MSGSGPQDLYVVLGVAPDASPETIRHAYRELARHLHPDVGPGGEEAFRTVSAAYEVLGDERRRATYDRRRAPGARVDRGSRRRASGARSLGERRTDADGSSGRRASSATAGSRRAPAEHGGGDR